MSESKAEQLVRVRALIQRFVGNPSTRRQIEGRDAIILEAEIVRLEGELKDWEQSFEIYDNSIRELTTYYHKKHPNEKDTLPDTSRLVAWLLKELKQSNTDRDRAIEIARERGKLITRCVDESLISRRYTVDDKELDAMTKGEE